MDTLSDDSAEYAAALLMNLSIRSSGKKQCNVDRDRVLNILTGLMEHENLQVGPIFRSYTTFISYGSGQNICEWNPVRSAVRQDDQGARVCAWYRRYPFHAQEQCG